MCRPSYPISCRGALRTRSFVVTTSNRNASSLRRRVAATSLPGQSVERSYEVGPTEWPRFLGSLVRERLTGFAVAAAEQGSLTLGDGEREELLEQHRSAML